MNSDKELQKITILGGGPAGLSVGYYAQKKGFDFQIFEANLSVGGNCRTIKYKDFYFDLGAHRFHDKNKDVTEEICTLMGEQLKCIAVPSQIYFNKKYIDFPLTPLDLLIKLGFYSCIKALFSKLLTSKRKQYVNFHDFIVARYGRIISKWFLIDYSEKLWGEKTKNLSPIVAGKRLKGLTFKTLIIEILRGKKEKTKHLDGSFFYPDYGFGSITEKLAEACSRDKIYCEKKISSVLHSNNKITHVEINQNEMIPVGEIISSLPISQFIHLLQPIPDKRILEFAKNIKYRSLKLVILFIEKNNISANASIYFPEKKYPFTRIYESKNRSIFMSPKGKTSLVVEVPFSNNDALSETNDSQLIKSIKETLIQEGFFKGTEFLEAIVKTVPFAYPIFELEYEKNVEELFNYLSNFTNLSCCGRNGLFEYTHLHDLMEQAKVIVDSMQLK